MFLSVNGQSAGLLAVSDPIKASTAEALATLKASGLRVIMATGDGLTTAKAVAAALDIDEVHGEVKPADKLEMVSKLQREGRIVAYHEMGHALVGSANCSACCTVSADPSVS